MLGFPNDEVRYAFLEQLMDVYTSVSDDYSGEFMIGKFLASMESGDIDRVLALIQSLLASIPYDSLPKDKLFLREHNYQTAIYLIFHLMGQYVKTEVHSSAGCSDVEVETADAIYIFEFKVGDEPSKAIIQIKESGYADKHKSSDKSIFLIGVNISQKKQTLDEWLIEKIR